MTVDLQLVPILDYLVTGVWPFVRIGAFVMVMPVVGGGFVPTRVRLLLALALTAVITPSLPVATAPEVFSAAGLVTIIQEVAIGVVLGFLVQLVFDAIALGGQIIAMSMGLGFAVFLDKSRGVNVPVLGQMFLMLSMLVFFEMDGHLALIQLLAHSFHAWPISSGGIGAPIVGELLQWSTQLFVFALKVALPAITAILVVNLAFGAMSRAAPTLNLFAVGFPVSMLLGFTVIFFNMDVFLENATNFFSITLSALAEMLAM